MSSIWGNNIKVSLFGESHGEIVGVVIDGLPPGKKICMQDIAIQLHRRAPCEDISSTQRSESDIPNIVSGMLNGYTTGAPICALFDNTGQDSSAYEKNHSTPRPGHSDYTTIVKSNGYGDIRGGGHLSGRLTCPLTFAGTICRQVLSSRNVNIAAHAYSIGHVTDESFDTVNPDNELISRLSNERFPVILPNSKDAMIKEITQAKDEGDSIGGIVECIVTGIPAGIGMPIFDNIESRLSSIIFAIPGIKAIEFGSGNNQSTLSRGSISNDDFTIREGRVKTITNNHGGVLGGISSGMPIAFRVTIKPTPSISKQQKTINLHTMQPTTLSIAGHHDACIVPRVIPVIEATTAICMLDLLYLDSSFTI